MATETRGELLWDTWEDRHLPSNGVPYEFFHGSVGLGRPATRTAPRSMTQSEITRRREAEERRLATALPPVRYDP